MTTTRRQLLAHAAGLAGAALLPSGWTSDALAAASPAYPFTLGVASGEPAPDGMVLWTRLAPRPLDADGGMPRAPAVVRWEVAEDDTFRRVVARGRALAAAEAAHSVHVEVAGLRPDRVYWYRFTALGHASPAGRTRTTPAPGAAVDRLRVAFASCQKYETGFYGAYEHMVADAPDVVLFLGDYIYEQAATANGVRRHPVEAAHDLATYRLRYGLYKSDPLLQAAHAAAPWVVIWDDHEVQNDYGGGDSVPATDHVAFLKRRAAAYQAYYEHMPLRRRQIPVGPDMLLYRTLDWGRLAQFQLLDGRQYRPAPTCAAIAKGKDIPDCPERTADNRSLLGFPQERWLMKTLGASEARWNLLAQQYLMGEVDRRDAQGQAFFSNDAWSGYAASRRRVLERWRDARVSNPLALGGDVHSFVAGDLELTPGKPVASELVGGSISSTVGYPAGFKAMVAANPHLRFADAAVRGYGLADLTPKGCDIAFRAVRNALVPRSEVFNAARFHVEDGVRGLRTL